MSIDLLHHAQEYCADHKHRYTDPRRYVLEIIIRADKPLGAYDILQKLGLYLDNPKPPTAYRAIDFWVEQGFVHRIESLNAYVSCHAGHQHAGSQYLICDQCHTVEEIHLCSIPEKLSAKAKSKKFSPQSWNVEIHGLCSACL